MILEPQDGWSETYELGVGRSLTKRYVATLSAAEITYDPSVLRATAEGLGLPTPYLSLIDGVLVKSVNAEVSPKSKNLILYTVQADLRPVGQQTQQKLDDPDPVNWNPTCKVLINGIEVPTEYDRDGKAIMNSAGVRLLDRLTLPDTELGFEITCNVATVPSWYTTLRKTQNSSSTKIYIIPARGAFSGVYYTAAAGTLRFMPGAIEADQWNQIDYLRITFRLEVSRPQKMRLVGDASPVEYNSWNHMQAYLDCGFTYYDGTDWIKITIGQNGEEPREEMLLDGAGGYDAAAQGPDDAISIVPPIYTDASYTSLPGCTA